ncbi:MAG: thioredoxin domain-containing protein [Actinomycetales bacterium]
MASATSPYLLQHKDNPVDWWEWGEEAFAEASRRDVPVLLSVGYAACHWCHVMAHESFEDALTAREMNEGFVCVKVDREERPDVDAVYMEATQALTGHGGWPMTVFLTPEGRPVFAGTYYPPSPRQGLPSFRQVLAAIGEAWRERRADVADAGERITAQLAQRGTVDGDRPLDADGLAAAVTALRTRFDEERGGFGGAPKFPPSMVLEWLLRHAARTGGSPSAADAVHMAGVTFRAMAGSGMYDQLEGGFARYAVDAGWVVPHFEKMLYDNALLARTYLHWWRQTGTALGRRVALETCHWMVRVLGTAEGGLAASLDADTALPDGHGVEGLTYVWTPAELTEVLGPADGPWVAALCGVTDAGTFEHGSSTLQLLRVEEQLTEDERVRWAAARALLTQRRAERAQPGRDDKVVAAWNGLAVAALAETGALTDRPDLVEAARAVAGLLLDVHLVDDRLRRVSRGGVVGAPAGVLEDYADVIEGLLALAAVTGESRWYDAVSGLVDTVVDRFWDEPSGTFRDTADDAVDASLVAALGGRGRLQDPTDGATPSGTSAAAGVLLAWSALTGSSRHRDLAERALAQTAVVGRQVPQVASWALAVTEALADGPREVAVLGPDRDPRRTDLHRVALAGTAPGLVVAVAQPGATHPPLVADRPLVGGRPAAYPCRGMVCDLPVTSPGVLADWTGTRLPLANGLDASE